jgi:hypothetical protein
VGKSRASEYLVSFAYLIEENDENEMVSYIDNKHSGMVGLFMYDGIESAVLSVEEIDQLKKEEQFNEASLTNPGFRDLIVEESDLDHWFNQYGSEYGIDVVSLKSIAKCESGLNPNAINGIYGGLFQFSGSTWTSNRNAMGLDSDIGLRFNPEEAIRTAAFKIGRDGMGAWPVCQYR